ncbi:MAG: acyl-CoA thioesterase [Gammaproteobacteria bacterium]|nr:acyl-CoA thioesterase [Gammaproteobacteria bacterium]
MADTDASRWIHFAAVMRYFEEAEFSMMKTLGLDFLRMEAMGFAFPRRKITTEYHRALKIDDCGRVTVRVARLGNTSLTFHYELLKDGETEPHVEAEFVTVCTNVTTGKTVVIPDRIRAALSGG